MDNLPSLIEPGTKYFIQGTLKQCKAFKEKYISTIFNISASISLCVIVSIILWWRYKGKLTPGEIAEKNRQKQEYIISKLQQLSSIRTKNNMLTDLPTFDSHPELAVLQKR